MRTPGGPMTRSAESLARRDLFALVPAPRRVLKPILYTRRACARRAAGRVGLPLRQRHRHRDLIEQRRLLAVPGRHQICRFDLPSRAPSEQEVATVWIPTEVAFTPDGRTAFVASVFKEQIGVVSVAGDHKRRRSVPTDLGIPVHIVRVSRWRRTPRRDGPRHTGRDEHRCAALVDPRAQCVFFFFRLYIYSFIVLLSRWCGTPSVVATTSLRLTSRSARPDRESA